MNTSIYLNRVSGSGIRVYQSDEKHCWLHTDLTVIGGRWALLYSRGSVSAVAGGIGLIGTAWAQVVEITADIPFHHQRWALLYSRGSVLLSPGAIGVFWNSAIHSRMAVDATQMLRAAHQ